MVTDEGINYINMKAWYIFYKNILKNNLIKQKDKIIISVSGGIDSVCMLHMFWRIKKKINIDILVVVFNHRLRKESKYESNFVNNLSSKFNIKCIKKIINVKKYSKEKSISIETAARDLRYSNLISIAKKYKYNKIATAHNANDNAETMFMWIIRGTGNFIGIPQSRQIDRNIYVIRPLLAISRKFIEQYIKFHKLNFCIDKSNFLYKYTRNKIRSKIIPICEEINPMAMEHIFNLSEIQYIENEYLEKIVYKYIKECVKIYKNKILLDLVIFLRYNKPIMLRIIKYILPKKKYNSCINLIINKIMSNDVSVYKISDEWIFFIKLNKACFYNINKIKY
jgi:tRNA(Ile)-lysidine synthase